MLTAQIRSDMIAAMKAHDALRVETLRGAITACTNELVTKGRKPIDELTDMETIIVLKRLAKQRKDSIAQFTKGNRPDLAKKESDELKIIESYLPQNMSRTDILNVAKAKKAELGITDTKDMGKLIGAVMKELAGSADGGDVREVVMELFA
jgi:hypothetical protein